MLLIPSTSLALPLSLLFPLSLNPTKEDAGLEKRSSWLPITPLPGKLGVAFLFFGITCDVSKGSKSPTVADDKEEEDDKDGSGSLVLLLKAEEAEAAVGLEEAVLKRVFPEVAKGVVSKGSGSS